MREKKRACFCMSTFCIDTCNLLAGADSHFHSSRQALGVDVPYCSHLCPCSMGDPEMQGVGKLLLLKVRRCRRSWAMSTWTGEGGMPPALHAPKCMPGVSGASSICA